MVSVGWREAASDCPGSWEAKAGSGVFAAHRAMAFSCYSVAAENCRVGRVRQCCLNPSHPVLAKRRKYIPFVKEEVLEKLASIFFFLINYIYWLQQALNMYSGSSAVLNTLCLA